LGRRRLRTAALTSSPLRTSNWYSERAASGGRRLRSTIACELAGRRLAAV
jgi:hypothetical protein